MTQKEYLLQLEQEIQLLDQEIAEDILEYYKTRFEEEKRYENKSEEEIIKSLGSPEDLGHRIYESYGVKKELWENAREEVVDTKRAALVLLFDVFVASWVIPLLAFVVLTGLAAFITFPFVIAALPGLVISDVFLVLLLAIGTYSILLLLLLGIAELSIIVTKHILIMNFKVLTPHNKTTSRLLKSFSLFSWMRRVKMNRNIFINIGMVALTLVSMSFLMLVNMGTNFSDLLATQPTITEHFEESMIAELQSRDQYNVIIDVGDTDIKINSNSGSNFTLDHTYNYEDYLSYQLDTENNTLIITTIPENINDGFLTTYKGSITISLPYDLIIDSFQVNVTDSSINLIEFDMVDLELNMNNGELLLYDIDSDALTVNGNHIDVTIIDSFFDEIDLVSLRGYFVMKNVNNMRNDGYFLNADVSYGVINLSNTYFREFYVNTYSADVYFNNVNDLYNIDVLNITTLEGTLYIQQSYKELINES